MANITNSNTTTTTSPPPPPIHGGGYASSTALNIILSFLALICVPLFIYAFFFCLKCPPHPSDWRRRRSSATESSVKAVHTDLVYKIGVGGKKGEETSECPVCLSVYVVGDEVRLLNNCKHRFHVSCINKWLSSHNNCPICRASVGVKQFNQNQSGRTGDYDFHQGLPDSDSLV